MKLNYDSIFSDREKLELASPQPGEIWEVSRKIISPFQFSEEEKRSLYPASVQKFLTGNSPRRFVAIVKESESISEIEPEWKIVYVMLFSEKISFASNVDLLVSQAISKLEQPLLAETWQIEPMLTCNLLRRVGERLSRKTYDILLKIGDYYHNLVNEYPLTSEIEGVGLKTGSLRYQESEPLRLFHQEETEWSKILHVPVAACYSYFKTLNFTDELFQESLQIQQDISTLSLDDLEGQLLNIKQVAIDLSKWLDNHIIEPLWQKPEVSLALRSYNLASSLEEDRIERLIEKLSPQYSELERRDVAKQLGTIIQRKDLVIPALLRLFATTESEETMWIAIENIWKLDSADETLGLRRVKKLDLEIAEQQKKKIILECRLIQKSQKEVGLIFRVYCQNQRVCLPLGLELILLDEFQEILHQVRANRKDLYIQLRFSGVRVDRFSIKVAYRDSSVTENFII